MTEIEPQTVRVQITRDGKTFFEGDVQVYPWHIGNYGGDWEMWLRKVAPEWVDRVASGIRDEAFEATATDLSDGVQLSAVTFTHTTTPTVTVTVENEASGQIDRALDTMFRRLGPPDAEK